MATHIQRFIPNEVKTRTPTASRRERMKSPHVRRESEKETQQMELQVEGVRKKVLPDK